ncbi:hypothetical protein LINGRAHAP2_LOCUS27858, partial [Linum grandiflorum]
VDYEFIFTQISTTNLDLHTNRLESASNPPKRLCSILDFMFFVMFFIFFSMFFVFFFCFQVQGRMFLEMCSEILIYRRERQCDIYNGENFKLLFVMKVQIVILFIYFL